ncbi:toxin-antitoxin system HicB family antitoxin [Tissierella sp.]|uniref:type II toxin-antitoxin system HicB family antitoxin n=1 Tax=Tissierella sp. TaxID=41274 RepID=UPI00285F4816|nr:toxin-antitoxin system HicB family antitoxin [Tissierella sp.]MDR7856505.1 toxin-antitoxin system HicB family antitoxin [Tissierella sp.]
MKNIDYYMNLNYKIEVVKEESEGGYVISIPELKGCITSSDDIEKGMELIEDAKWEWIKAAIESEYEIPEPNTLEKYSGQFKLRIPKSLHMDLAEQSKQEGISMNQYCLYLLSKNIAKTNKVKDHQV